MKIHLMHVPGVWPERDELVSWYRANYDVCLHEDPEQRGVLFNHLGIIRCLYEQDLSTRWHLVVQDDAHPCANWLSHLDDVMWNAPAPFVSLCHFGGYGRRLVDKGVPFGVGKNTIWGQAVLYGRGILPSYLRLVEDVAEMDYERYRKWDDGLMSVHNLLHGTTSCMTSRALFQHADWDSTMGHVKGQWRHAEATIETDPLGPKWSGIPRSAGGTPGVEKVQKELAERLRQWRLER